MGINVLSLCDGMAGARIALEKTNILVDSYYAAEIKEHAIKCATSNYPDIIEIGNIKNILYNNGVLYTKETSYKIKFDLVCFGFPCQSLSNLMPSNMKIGLKDLERSGLFYECFRILQEVNPPYWFVENVASMKKEDAALLSEYLGCEPYKIDSQIIAPAMRKRLYWTNIPLSLIEKNNYNLQDILEKGWTDRKKARALIANSNSMTFAHTPSLFRRYYQKGFGTVVFENKEHFENILEMFQQYKDLDAATYKEQTLLDDNFIRECNKIRLLNQTELEKCMTVPVGYTKMLNYKDAANLLGDGWTIDVIVKFFENIR